MAVYDHSLALEETIATLEEKLKAGEDVQEQLDALNEIKAELKENYVEELCKLYSDNQAMESALANEIAKLQEKKAAYASRNAQIKKYLEVELQASGEKKLQAGIFTVSNLKSTSCVIYEELFDDPRFQTITEVRKIDKMAVKAALKAGETIKGAALEERNNIQVK